MALVVIIVIVAFGLLYLAVLAEERHMQEVKKPHKR